MALAALNSHAPSEKSPEIAQAHEAVAHAALLLGTPSDLQLALENMGAALAMQEALFGSAGLEVAACQNMLAVIYLQLNRCEMLYCYTVILTKRSFIHEIQLVFKVSVSLLYLYGILFAYLKFYTYIHAKLI